MKDEHNDKKKTLSREEWLRLAARKAAVEPEGYDAFSRDAIKGLQYVQDEEQLRAALKQLDKRVDGLAGAGKAPPAKRRNHSFLIKALATAAILLFAMGVFHVYHDQPPSIEQLYTEYFEAVGSAIPQTGLRKTGLPDNTLQHKQLALQDYERRAYLPAIDHFTTYLHEVPDDAEMRFYFGVALMGAGRFPEAESQLERVLRETTKPTYRTGCRWYLALTALRQDRPDQARAYLERLIENSDADSSYRRKARQLRRNLPVN